MQTGRNRSALTSAAFLMATSAIGPGFLTQTAYYTWQTAASFGFVILISVLLDIGAQLNIWRLLTVTGMRAHEFSNNVFPGLGYILGGLIVFGGLAFNIGNVGGCALGMNLMTGVGTEWSAALSTLIALAVFLSPGATGMMDIFVKTLGIGMIFFTVAAAFLASPPAGEALYRTLVPLQTDSMAIITLVGGTVGGYISFAGAHRLLDAGITGAESVGEVNTSAIRGIAITALMRYVLFLAALGVVSSGVAMDTANPAAGVFRHIAGNTGTLIFGFVMWSAAITSVIGAAYTSVSFMRDWHHVIERYHRQVTALFILVSATILILLGKPAQLLVLAGTINGFILPFALAVFLMAVYRKQLPDEYRHPRWLTTAGWLVTILMFWLAICSVR